MSKSSIYLLLAVVGAIVPWWFFLDFFSAQGTAEFLPALFVNGAAGGFSADLLITSLVFWVFLFPAAQRSGVGRPWIYVLINLVIGLSCALPLFLWARERAGGRSRSHRKEPS